MKFWLKLTQNLKFVSKISKNFNYLIKILSNPHIKLNPQENVRWTSIFLFTIKFVDREHGNSCSIKWTAENLLKENSLKPHRERKALANVTTPEWEKCCENYLHYLTIRKAKKEVFSWMEIAFQKASLSRLNSFLSTLLWSARKNKS